MSIPPEPFAVAHLALSKFVVLGMLFWSTVWCGGIYKALKHQEIVNKHRALSILTLQAFRDSATDNASKDAVVMEAARAVFGNVPTGMLGAKENLDTGGLQILDRFMPSFGVSKT